MGRGSKRRSCSATPRSRALKLRRSSTPLAGAMATSTTMRPLAVRINDDLRAQLDVIAQLNDRSVTEEIRIALEAWVETSKSDPKVLERAEIEREARMKQGAIEAIFGPVAPSRSRGRWAEPVTITPSEPRGSSG